MKTKKVRGKLSLTKSTIANLADHELNGARGGALTVDSCFFSRECDTNFAECTNPDWCQCTDMCTYTCPTKRF